MKVSIIKACGLTNQEIVDGVLVSSS